MHKTLLIFIVAAVGFGALVTIVQIWTIFLSWDVYFKLIITIGILVLLAGFVIVVKADLGEKKKLKDDNYLD